MALLPTIESELEPFEYRPHLGKLFTIAPTLLHSRFEKFLDFLKLLNSYDPKGKLRNAYLDRIIVTT
jgi:alditol oxidase